MTTAHANTMRPDLLHKEGHPKDEKPKLIVKKFDVAKPKPEFKLSLLPPGAFSEVGAFFRGVRRQWVLSSVIFALLIGGVSVLLYLDFQHNKAMAQQMTAYRSCVNTLLSMHVDAKNLSNLGIDTHRFYDLNDPGVMAAEVGQCETTVATLQRATPPEGWTRWRMRAHLNQILPHNS